MARMAQPLWMVLWLLSGAFLANACTQADTGSTAPAQNANTPQPAPGATTQNGNPNTGATAGNGNAATDPQVVVPAAQGANVRYMGRVDGSDANGPIISWPGSQIIIGFNGTALTVDLLEMDQASYSGAAVDNYFSVTIDNVASTRIKLSHTATSYLVASALPKGQHQVVLTKLTEGQMGRVQYLGSKTDGTLTFTTAAPTRRLEFIGDSGTAGYGAGGTFPCTFSAATEDASVAYPAVVGSLLSAEARNLSYSGKGLVQNRDMVNDSYKTLPVLWVRTLPNDENVTTYNPNGWVPQAVVMTIGGNDFYNQVLDQNTFNATVIAFIKKVQAQYSGVHVYLGVSPMLRDDNHPNQREDGIAYAQAAVTSMADSHVHYVALPADLGTNGYGCDEHMTPATHKVTANAIVQTLKAQLGW